VKYPEVQIACGIINKHTFCPFASAISNRLDWSFHPSSAQNRTVHEVIEGYSKNRNESIHTVGVVPAIDLARTIIS